MAFSNIKFPAYFSKPRMTKTAIAGGIVLAAGYVAVAAYEHRLEKRMEAVFPAAGQWEVSGAFPLLDAFYIGSIRTLDTPFITARRAFFFGLPFQYAFSRSDRIRFDKVNIDLTAVNKLTLAENIEDNATLHLYNMFAEGVTEFPDISVRLQTPIGIFTARGNAAVSTDELDNAAKTIRGRFKIEDENVRGNIAVRGRLTSDGTLNGQIILESAIITQAIGVSGKRIGGVLDFEKRVGADWILSGEGSAGFMNVLGKELSSVEMLYLDDKQTSRTLLLKADDMKTGMRSDFELTFDKNGMMNIKTDTSDRSAETGE